MPDWLLIVAMIGGVLVAGMVRERWRLRAMEVIAKQHDFVMHSPFVPGERPPMAELAERFVGKRATRWGAGLTGVYQGLEIAIAEHEMPATGADSIGVWHVMVAWPLGIESTSADWLRNIQRVRDGEWAAWRLRGNLTPANVKLLLAHLHVASQP